jgi:phage gp46-like protein
MDISMIETGNGGDLVRTTRDLKTIDGFENMIYLSMFGGNVEGDTPVQRLDSQQAVDYWGNTVAFAQDQGMQFNSQTERSLIENALTSAGRSLIEQAVKNDLIWMKVLARIGVSVSIIGIDKVLIAIRVIRPDNLQQRDFIYIWDATLKELLEDVTLG